MLRVFPLVLILELICLYHAYKNDAEQKWYWLIIMFPFFGCLIYLYDHFYNRQTVDVVSEAVTQVVKSNYKVDKLEKDVAFSGTVSNRILLAQEYIKNEAYERAIDLYESCLTGSYSDDPELLMGLIKAHYLNKNYEEVLKYGSIIENERDFEKSEERIAYAWALSNLGDKQKAEEIFQAMDHQFSNYSQRMAYCNFLIEGKRETEAKSKIQEMMTEIEHMDRSEKRSKQTIYQSIKGLYNSLA